MTEFGQPSPTSFAFQLGAPSLLGSSEQAFWSPRRSTINFFPKVKDFFAPGCRVCRCVEQLLWKQFTYLASVIAFCNFCSDFRRSSGRKLDGFVSFYLLPWVSDQ